MYHNKTVISLIIKTWSPRRFGGATVYSILYYRLFMIFEYLAQAVKDSGHYIVEAVLKPAVRSCSQCNIARAWFCNDPPAEICRTFKAAQQIHSDDVYS